jgi:hypothetical protein
MRGFVAQWNEAMMIIHRTRVRDPRGEKLKFQYYVLICRTGHVCSPLTFGYDKLYNKCICCGSNTSNSNGVTNNLHRIGFCAYQYAAQTELRVFSMQWSTILFSLVSVKVTE